MNFDRMTSVAVTGVVIRFSMVPELRSSATLRMVSKGTMKNTGMKKSLKKVIDGLLSWGEVL